jgi:hypothetical protein
MVRLAWILLQVLIEEAVRRIREERGGVPSSSYSQYDFDGGG